MDDELLRPLNFGVLCASPQSFPQILQAQEQWELAPSLVACLSAEDKDKGDAVCHCSPQHDFIAVAPIAERKKERWVLSDWTQYPQAKAVFHHSLYSPLDLDLIYQAMLKCRDYDLLYLALPNSFDLFSDGEAHEGSVSFELGLRGLPRLGEHLFIAQHLELARAAGVRLHFVQISSTHSLDLIEQAKNAGLPISVGVSPAHLLYTHESLRDFNHHYKYFPPLREEGDRLSLLDGVRRGVIDTLASGFLSAPIEDVNFSQAPFLGASLSSFSPQHLQHLKNLAQVSDDQWYQLLVAKPRRILHLPGFET